MLLHDLNDDVIMPRCTNHAKRGKLPPADEATVYAGNADPRESGVSHSAFAT